MVPGFSTCSTLWQRHGICTPKLLPMVVGARASTCRCTRSHMPNSCRPLKQCICGSCLAHRIRKVICRFAWSRFQIEIMSSCTQNENIGLVAHTTDSGMLRHEDIHAVSCMAGGCRHCARWDVIRKLAWYRIDTTAPQMSSSGSNCSPMIAITCRSAVLYRPDNRTAAESIHLGSTEFVPNLPNIVQPSPFVTVRSTCRPIDSDGPSNR